MSFLLEINLPEALIRSPFNHHTSSRTYLYYYLNFTYKDPQAPLSNLPHSGSGAELGLETQRFFIQNYGQKGKFSLNLPQGAVYLFVDHHPLQMRESKSPSC